MSLESEFLVSLGQALATMSLYGEKHPARDRALGDSFDRLLDLTASTPAVEFSFLGAETVVGTRVMGELAHWDWAARLAAGRIERIEIDADVTRDAYLSFVDELFMQLNGRCADTALARQMVRPPIRFGRLRVRDAGTGGVAGEAGTGPGEGAEGDGLAVPIRLTEEIAAVRWIHEEVERAGAIPMAEVEAVVHSLAAAMHQQENMLVPLLLLKQYDQYTTTHACNVAVLSMGLAERLGFAPAEVRAVGVAGLLHDIGKIAIPHELLVKPGRYTDAEREIIQSHPVDGARMILQRERGLGLGAVVAYEHHIHLDGGGYPAMRFSRACHYASRVVHVCDIYDALCTDRPYRQAWEPEQALSYLVEKSGTELDSEIVQAFVALISESLVKRLDMDRELADLESAAPVAEGADGAGIPAAGHLWNRSDKASVLGPSGPA